MVKKKKKKRAPTQRPPIENAPAAPEPEILPAKLEEAKLVKREHKCHGPASELIPPPDEMLDSNRYLRWSGGLYYTTDLRGTTLEQMAKHPYFGKVTFNTLANWSTQDRWVERRQQNLDQWRRLIENKIGSELVKARTEQLTQMRKLFDKLMKKAMAGRLKTRSLEGAVSALVKLADLMDNWNDKLFRVVIPDMPGGSMVSPMSPGMMASAKPKLTQSEARRAARAVLDERRETLRREIAKDKGDEKPKLQVLDGEK